MAVSSVRLPSDVAISKLTFVNPRSISSSGAKSVSILYEGKPLVIQVSNLLAPYGMNELTADNGDIKYSLNLSLPDNKEDDLYKLLEGIDRKATQEFFVNCQKWCNRTVKTFEAVELLYTPVVKQSKDEKYPPTFKIQVPSKDQCINVDVFDASRQRVDDPSKLGWKRAKVSAILQCGGMWITGNRFGITFKAVQFKVCPWVDNRIVGYAFKDDVDADE